jgi:transcriptional regulator with XRE-family HTH domain
MSPPKSTKNLPSNLRRLRQEAGLTQAQLASAADLADATVSRIERGRLTPSVALAQRLAKALAVPVDALLGPAPSEPSKAKLRPSVARLVAVVRDLDDGQVDDVTRGLKLIMGAARR